MALVDGTRPGPVGPSSTLDVAILLARRLAGAAQWDGDRCWWPGVASPDSAPDAAASGALYAGSSGTALFLAQAYRLAPDLAVRDAARGAAAHALRWLGDVRPRAGGFGFGPIGALWAVLRIARALEDTVLERTAHAAIDHQLMRPPATLAHDVLGGRAGSVLGWLAIGATTRRAECLAAAEAVGRSLLMTALRHPRGWAWGRPRESASVACLLGFAHGTSGVIAALAALRDATGAPEYAHAVARGLAYEDQFFDARARSWRDLRHPELESMATRLARGTLAPRDLVARTVGPLQPRFAYAWCHGLPGILFGRLAAIRAATPATLDARAATAFRALRARGPGGRALSLCHGAAGFTDLLLEASRVLADADLATEATEAVYDLMTRVACRSSTGDEASVLDDPGLFTGCAGIGYTLLRHDDPSLPSPLSGAQPATGGRPGGQGVPSASQALLLREEADAQFPQTLRVLTARRSTRAPLADVGVSVMGRGVGRAIRTETPGRWRRLLRDASRVERTRWDVTHLPFDPWADFAAPLVLAHVDEPGALDELVLAPTARLVHCRYDWTAWSGAGSPARRPLAHLVWRFDGEVRERAVDALTAQLCAQLRRPGSREALLAQLFTLDAAGRAASDTLHAATRDRLRRLWRDGALRMLDTSTLTGRRDTPPVAPLAGPHPRDAAVLP